MKICSFLPGWYSGVENFKYMCSGFCMVSENMTPLTVYGWAKFHFNI